MASRPDWRGYFLGGFALVWIANVYMSAFGELRLEIRKDRQDIAIVDKTIEQDPIVTRPVEVQRPHRL